MQIVVIEGENYKIYREATQIFSNRNAGKNIHNATVMRILENFK